MRLAASEVLLGVKKADAAGGGLVEGKRAGESARAARIK